MESRDAATLLYSRRDEVHCRGLMIGCHDGSLPGVVRHRHHPVPRCGSAGSSCHQWVQAPPDSRYKGQSQSYLKKTDSSTALALPEITSTHLGRPLKGISGHKRLAETMDLPLRDVTVTGYRLLGKVSLNQRFPAYYDYMSC